MNSTIAVLIFTPLIIFVLQLTIKFITEYKIKRFVDQHFMDRKFKVSYLMYLGVSLFLVIGIGVISVNNHLSGIIIGAMFFLLFLYSLYRLQNFYVVIQEGNVVYRNGKKQVIFSLNSIKEVKISQGTIDINRNRKEIIQIPIYINKLSLLVAMLRKYRP
ncbi:hypothetical protein [Paenibacillus terrigena]|uniref:hypothetical protein n=1 Tax=Paenibacillus terrigena TaxID=369333 RepID=UPI00037E7342|nr:hypothetical protein [Paenibacillus terrigena]